jgi:hypothetical protein
MREILKINIDNFTFSCKYLILVFYKIPEYRLTKFNKKRRHTLVSAPREKCIAPCSHVKKSYENQDNNNNCYDFVLLVKRHKKFFYSLPFINTNGKDSTKNNNKENKVFICAHLYSYCSSLIIAYAEL